MCKEATEIQEQWQIDEQHDFYKIVDTDKEHGGLLIWLPRQDQLQDMIGPYIVAYTLFGIWKKKPQYHVGKKPFYPFNIFTSLEQCWLAFVMRERYSKKWTGKTWELIE